VSTKASSRLKFKAETRRVLDIVINSLYSHREIFLRELISNASDALDRLRFEALTREHLLPEGHEPEIHVIPDENAGTLTVTDNGVGMSRSDLTDSLGTIASSGTLRFAAEAASREDAPELIGRFGVGFYSSFMVADRVTVTTRRAGEREGWRWESDGGETYTIAPEDGLPQGTSVALHLKEDHREYLEAWRLRSLVTEYSDFVTHPVLLHAGDGRVERVNTGTPVWLRNEDEVDPEEYDRFYSHLTHDQEKPLARIVFRGEGLTEFRALLFIPRERPFEMLLPDNRPGVGLYVRRVLIQKKADDLLPPWLRFVRGVVEAEGLSLNISRETVQHNQELSRINRALTKKIIARLREIMEEDPEAYKGFFRNMGDFIREGVCTNAGMGAELAELLLAETSASEEPEPLVKVAERFPEKASMPYIAGLDMRELRRSPLLESRQSEVLLFDAPLDALVAETLREFRGRPLVNLAADDAEKELTPGERERRAEAEQKYSHLMDRFREILGDRVAGVRFSPTLTETPCILVAGAGDPGDAFRMMMRAMNRQVEEPGKILEINPGHPMTVSLDARLRAGEDITRQVEMVLELARIISGMRPDDPAAFGRFVGTLI
jgi:molecular chaperone HtpG